MTADELFARVAQCASRIAAIGRADVMGVARARRELADLRADAAELSFDGRELPNVVMSVRKLVIDEPVHPDLIEDWRALKSTCRMKGIIL